MVAAYTQIEPPQPRRAHARNEPKYRKEGEFRNVDPGRGHVLTCTKFDGDAFAEFRVEHRNTAGQCYPSVQDMTPGPDRSRVGPSEPRARSPSRRETKSPRTDKGLAEWTRTVNSAMGARTRLDVRALSLHLLDPDRGGENHEDDRRIHDDGHPSGDRDGIPTESLDEAPKAIVNAAIDPAMDDPKRAERPASDRQGDSRRSGSRGRIVPAEVSASLTSGAIRAKRESSPLRRQRGHPLRTAVVAVYLFSGTYLRGSMGERAMTDTKAGEAAVTRGGLPRSQHSLAVRALQELVSFLVRWCGVALLVRSTIARRKVSILVYHDPTPEALERHLRYLSRTYTFVTLDRLATALHTQDWSQIPPRAVVITLDDGRRGNARLTEIFKRFSVTPTIYVCSQIAGTNRHFWFLDVDDNEALRALSHPDRISHLEAIGFVKTKEFPSFERQALTRGELEVLAGVSEIGSHGRFHPILTMCSEEEAADEILLSKGEVEALSGRLCMHFGYPNGDYGAFERQVVKEAGYVSARTTAPGWNGRDADPYGLKAYLVPDDASVNRIAASLSGVPAHLGKLAWWRRRSLARVREGERPRPGNADLIASAPAHTGSMHHLARTADGRSPRRRPLSSRRRSLRQVTSEAEQRNSRLPQPSQRAKSPLHAAFIGHAWLPAALPSTARRFRVHDSDLRRTLSAAGADLVEDEPDVEIGDLKMLKGAADWAVVPLDEAQGEGGRIPMRAMRRLAASARVRLLAATTRHRLRQAGYSNVQVRLWDTWSTLDLGPRRATARRSTASDYLPQRALVIAARGPALTTHLDASIAEARAKTRLRLEPAPALTASGVLVMPMVDGVLRVALGQGQHRIDRQRAALEQLRALAPSPSVTSRVPWVLAVGACGLSRWSLERRLPGSLAIPPFEQSFLDDCVEFLSELHTCGRGTDRSSLALAARSAAECLPSRAARDIVEVGEILDDQLAGIPCGYAHGDFWHGNLFATEGGLVGVADWEAAGTGRLAVLDLVHFSFTSGWRRRRQATHWGEPLVREFLPSFSASDNHLMHSYLERVDLDITASELTALIAAYWLERVAYQLSTYFERLRLPMWMESNVEYPLRLLLDILRSDMSPRRPARAIKGQSH
jgi:peptidoglycan/xylan/chitin deacetylase (PgdA/CDA1 family)